MPDSDDIKNLRKDISFSTSLRDLPFVFHSTWGLFSPRSIDEGTLLLLKYLEIDTADDCLDLGCGYGPIGLTMAKLAPQGTTTLVDRDFKAIEYSKKNAELNQVNNVDILLSNGFDQIRDKNFNVVVSNIPAKVGNELMTLFFHDAYRQLKDNGRIYVVTINGLRDYIKRAFKNVFGNYKKLKQGKNYTVAMASKI
jgi:16S rRNA (guanine1207-N2)-methyltransferase